MPKKPGIVDGVGSIYTYLASSCQDISLSKVQDGLCRNCHRAIPEPKPASTVMILIKPDEHPDTVIMAKVFTDTITKLYTAIRPGISLLAGTDSEIEDRLITILPLHVQYQITDDRPTAKFIEPI